MQGMIVEARRQLKTRPSRRGTCKQWRLLTGRVSAAQAISKIGCFSRRDLKNDPDELSGENSAFVVFASDHRGNDVREDKSKNCAKRFRWCRDDHNKFESRDKTLGWQSPYGAFLERCYLWGGTKKDIGCCRFFLVIFPWNSIQLTWKIICTTTVYLFPSHWSSSSSAAVPGYHPRNTFRWCAK